MPVTHLSHTRVLLSSLQLQLQFRFLSDPTMYQLTAPGGAVVLVPRCARRVPSPHTRCRPRASDSISISISLPRNILLPPTRQLYNTTSTPTLPVTTLVLVLQRRKPFRPSNRLVVLSISYAQRLTSQSRGGTTSAWAYLRAGDRSLGGTSRIVEFPKTNKCISIRNHSART